MNFYPPSTPKSKLQKVHQPAVRRISTELPTELLPLAALRRRQFPLIVAADPPIAAAAPLMKMVMPVQSVLHLGRARQQRGGQFVSHERDKRRQSRRGVGIVLERAQQLVEQRVRALHVRVRRGDHRAQAEVTTVLIAIVPTHETATVQPRLGTVPLMEVRAARGRRAGDLPLGWLGRRR